MSDSGRLLGSVARREILRVVDLSGDFAKTDCRVQMLPNGVLVQRFDVGRGESTSTEVSKGVLQ